MAPAQGPKDLKATGAQDQVTYGYQIPGFKNRPSANQFPAVPCSSLQFPDLLKVRQGGPAPVMDVYFAAGINC